MRLLDVSWCDAIDGMWPGIPLLEPKVYARIAVEQKESIKPMKNDDWRKEQRSCSSVTTGHCDKTLERPLLSVHDDHLRFQRWQFERGGPFGGPSTDVFLP